MDPDYSKYGPIGICGYLQDEYGRLFKNGRWPALTDVQQPEGNNITPETPTPSPATSGPIALLTGTRQEEEQEEEAVLIEMVEMVEEEDAEPR